MSISFTRLMVIEMIDAQIVPNRDIIFESRNPILANRMARYFHDDEVTLCLYHTMKELIHFQRARCRIFGIFKIAGIAM